MILVGSWLINTYLVSGSQTVQADNDTGNNRSAEVRLLLILRLILIYLGLDLLFSDIYVICMIKSFIECVVNYLHIELELDIVDSIRLWGFLNPLNLSICACLFSPWCKV
jgi:hypothetical protein